MCLFLALLPDGILACIYTGARLEICLPEGSRGRRKGLVWVLQGYGKAVKGHGLPPPSSGEHLQNTWKQLRLGEVF